MWGGKRKFVLWLQIVFLILCGGSTARAGSLMPVWKMGDIWVVRAIYPSPANRAEWSTPVYWEYRVAGIEEQGPETFFVLEVKDRDNLVELNAQLLYREADLSLVEARIRKKGRRGKAITRTFNYEPGRPVRTGQSIIPYDTPVFPLIFPSSVQFSVKKRIAEGLMSVQNVRQDIREGAGAEVESGSYKGGGLIEVKCAGDDGTSIFVQYWREGLPWPVYGENRHMRYWLVEE